MSGFTPDWLELREPADSAARSASLCGASAGTAGDVLEVVDLGAGTGANLRYAAPRLGGRQRWRLVDDDAALLAAVPAAMRAWSDGLARGGAAPLVETVGPERISIRAAGLECDVVLVRADIAAELDAIDCPRGGLVTASALLDLVSRQWLESLADRCAAAGANALFALTYDGRIDFDAPDPGDERVRELVNRHQRRDKGFGPALGPDAGAAAAEIFALRGYTVATARSDWRLGSAERRLEADLADGWAAAAIEQSPADAAAIAGWRNRRASDIRRGRVRITVGHVDLAARPPPA